MSPQIDRIEVTPGMSVVVLQVSTGPNRPYSYKNQAYKRVGNTSLRLSRDEYNRMSIERFHGEKRWETEPASTWSVSDLDTAELTRTLDEAIRRGRMDDPGTREPQELLRGFGLMRDGVPLRAAVVLFGRRVRLESDFSQCLLRVAKFKGADKTEFLDNRQFYGNAFELLLTAERYLRENLPIAGRIVPDLFERIDDPLYPPLALREALANAFCHRDYSIGGGSVGIAIYQDRLEISSSGTLHFGLNAAKLFENHDSLPWNPSIARIFHRRGIIESWGRGTQKMAELTEKAGLPRPEIVEGTGYLVVRFLPGRYVPPRRVAHDVTARQQTILQLLSRHGPLALREIVSRLEGDNRALREDLGLMKHLGLIGSEGHGRGAFWFLIGE